MIWILSLISAALYAIAGKGGFKNAKLLRRCGCALVGCFALFVLGIKGSNILNTLIAYLATFGLSWGALSTYHDYLAPDGSSENWACWLMTGLCYGLSALPIAMATGMWMALALRAVACAVLVTVVREGSGIAWVEETGSGFIFTASLILFKVLPV